jgi:hypothetical protein
MDTSELSIKVSELKTFFERMMSEIESIYGPEIRLEPRIYWDLLGDVKYDMYRLPSMELTPDKLMRLFGWGDIEEEVERIRQEAKGNEPLILFLASFSQILGVVAFSLSNKGWQQEIPSSSHDPKT